MGHVDPPETSPAYVVGELALAAGVVNSLGHAAAIVSPVGEIIAQNKAMNDYLGKDSLLLDHLSPYDFDKPTADLLVAARRERLAAAIDISEPHVRSDLAFLGASAPLNVTPLKGENGTAAYLCQQPTDRQSEDPRLTFFLEHLDQGVWDFDVALEQMVVSEGWRKLRGLSKDEIVLGTNWLDKIHPDDRAHLKKAFDDQRFGETKTINVQYRHATKNGGWIWVLCRGNVMEADENGMPLRIVGTDTNITEIKQNEAEVSRLADKLQLAIDAAGMGIWEFDPEVGRVHWDDQMLKIYGVTDGENYRDGKDWEEFLHPDDLAETKTYADRNFLTGEVFDHDYRIVRHDGKIRHVRSIARRMSDGTANSNLIGVNMDVTADYRRTAELEAARAQLEYDSRHDALTGLANRRCLDEEVALLFECVTADSQYAVLHLDLDNFKQINDTLGHDAGDAVLVHVASVLRNTIGDAGLICRVGGDEFVVLFQDAPELTALETLGAALVETCQLPFVYQGHSCKFGASVGIAVAVGKPIKSSEIFIQADQALYEAKNAGRSCVRLYSPLSQSQMRDRLHHQQALVDAISKGAIQCHYQPQFDAATGALVGAEALVRWKCADRGLLLPDAFMPLAEDIGLSAQIDSCVFERVIADQTAWYDAGLEYPRIGINISPQRLQDRGFPEQMTRQLQSHHAVVCELLESSFLDDPSDTVQKNLEFLRQRGIGIELDDFGAGHASVVAMQAVRPDRVKIDKRLVLSVLHRPVQVVVLQNLVRIARLSGVGVVLEGVETSDHLDLLASVDCDVYQGYALGRPMPGDEFCALLKTHNMNVSQTA